MDRKLESTEWTKACLTGKHVAEIELVYRSKVKPSERPQIKNSRDTFDLFISHWDMDKIELLEQFKCMFLNRANRVLGIYEMSTGGTTGTIADAKLIFAAALKANANKLAISHNHPSGNLKPSNEDIALTRKLANAGKFLDMPVLDHLIITKDGYFSFCDEGLI